VGGPQPLRLLLDAHIFLWALLEPERLSPALAAALQGPASELWLSPSACGRTSSWPSGGGSSWSQTLSGGCDAPLREAPLTHEVALESQRLELSHRDPADCLLLATDRVYQLTLVTADRHLMGLLSPTVLPNLQPGAASTVAAAPHRAPSGHEGPALGRPSAGRAPGGWARLVIGTLD
jgi:PIN domain nuclease of toxin-antitoxin system